MGYLAFEEKQARGCPFGMLTDDKYGYCFFKMMADIERPMTEDEISKLLCLSKDQVKKIVETASLKLKDKEEIADLKKLFDSGSLFEEVEVEEDIYFPDHYSTEDSSPSEEE